MPGPVVGQVADALVASGATEEGLRLAREAMANGPRWRWPEAAEAALHGFEITSAWEEIRDLIPALGELRSGYPLLDAMAERADGRALLSAGDAQAGIAALRRAVAAFDRLSMPFEGARTREALAEAVPGEGRELLEEAVTAYRRLGAAPHLDRADRRLGEL